MAGCFFVVSDLFAFQICLWQRSREDTLERRRPKKHAVVHAACILTPSIVKIHFMFMCFAAASFPDRYILYIAMASRTVTLWIAAREKDIERAFNDKKLWNALDEVIHGHNYSFKSIAAWPMDACVVYAPTKRASLILGSLQAACHLKDIEAKFNRKVTIVVTMCKNEMKIAGAPADWIAYFKENNALQLPCQLDDITVKQPLRNAKEARAMTVACLDAWKLICHQLWDASIAAVLNDAPMNVLFHCFGGINRSAASLCAWLIVAYDYTAKEAIDLLLTKRPSLRPWRYRSYVLDALCALELEKVQWRTQFRTSNVEL